MGKSKIVSDKYVLSDHVLEPLMMMTVTSKENGEGTQVVKVRKMGERARERVRRSIACEAALPRPRLTCIQQHARRLF